MDIPFTWVGIVVVFLCSQYVVGPVMVWAQQRFPARFQLEPADYDLFLDDQSDTFLRVNQEILSLGFQLERASTLYMGITTTRFCIYWHPETQLTCTLATAVNSVLGSTQVEFTQMYTDGSALNITNGGNVSPFPAWKKKASFRFPNVNDVSRLYELALTCRRNFKSTADRQSLSPGNILPAVERLLNEELDNLIAVGYVSPYMQNGEYRLTVKGAIMMTWKMCWPVKVWLSKLDITRAKQLAQNQF